MGVGRLCLNPSSDCWVWVLARGLLSTRKLKQTNKPIKNKRRNWEKKIQFCCPGVPLQEPFVPVKDEALHFMGHQCKPRRSMCEEICTHIFHTPSGDRSSGRNPCASGTKTEDRISRIRAVQEPWSPLWSALCSGQ